MSIDCHLSRSHSVCQRRCVAIHGDMDQHSRAAALRDFSAGRQHVLVATDVAARGLDIKSIKTVVNLDSARDIDTHVHRVGRTGRAGDKDGTAWTLLDPREARFAGERALNDRAISIAVPTSLAVDLDTVVGRPCQAVPRADLPVAVQASC